MDVAADVSSTCRDLLKRLLDADWESRVFNNLSASLTARQPAALSKSAATRQSVGTYVVSTCYKLSAVPCSSADTLMMMAEAGGVHGLPSCQGGADI